MARTEIRNVLEGARRLRKRLDEGLTQFLEPKAFIHKPGCTTIALQREEIREEGYRHRTIRTCSGCGASDDFVIDYADFPPPRLWG